jgi:ubiquinone/menaquinone biosynthesis C-methylase UbiE
MSASSNYMNELKAAEAFTRQSKIFDGLYQADSIIRYKRKRVREHILSLEAPGHSILELNCGTGEDAIFFAGEGFTVYATDISEGMLDSLEQKIANTSVRERISTEQCSFTGLQDLQNKGPFDRVFSNFGGLNCTGEVETVLHSLTGLVKPGGVVTLVVISKFCFWETLLVFKGKFRTAFRRFFAKKGRRAHIEGSLFRCWYYSPGYLRKQLKNEFTVIGLEGLCTIVPPSYIEGFAEQHPRLFRFLKEKENRLKSAWPWNRAGDYFIMSFRKK